MRLTPAEQVDVLSEFGLTWKPRLCRWGESRDATAEYVLRNNRIPSFGAKDPDASRLGMWCQTQRQQYRKGRLSAERIAALEQIVGWFWGRADKWGILFGKVQRFIEEHGRKPRMGAECESERQLGVWVNRQLTSYCNNSLKLSLVNRLDSIPGWTWGQDGKWENMFILAQKEVSENGCLPFGKVRTKLTSWLYQQRKLKKEGRLSEERQRAMERLKGWEWETKWTRNKGEDHDREEEKRSSEEGVGHEAQERSVRAAA